MPAVISLKLKNVVF